MSTSVSELEGSEITTVGDTPPEHPPLHRPVTVYQGAIAILGSIVTLIFMLGTPVIANRDDIRDLKASRLQDHEEAKQLRSDFADFRRNQESQTRDIGDVKSDINWLKTWLKGSRP